MLCRRVRFLGCSCHVKITATGLEWNWMNQRAQHSDEYFIYCRRDFLLLKPLSVTNSAKSTRKQGHPAQNALAQNRIFILMLSCHLWLIQPFLWVWGFMIASLKKKKKTKMTYDTDANRWHSVSLWTPIAKLLCVIWLNLLTVVTHTRAALLHQWILMAGFEAFHVLWFTGCKSPRSSVGWGTSWNLFSSKFVKTLASNWKKKCWKKWHFSD